MHFKKPKTQLLFIILFVSTLAVLPLFTHAAGLVPCGGSNEKPCTVLDVFVLFARVTNFLIGFAAVFAVYEIINGAFWLAITMGNEEDMTKRKGQITSAIVGFVLAMMAFMFVNTVVNFILTNGSCEKLDLTNPTNYITINQGLAQCKKVK